MNLFTILLASMKPCSLQNKAPDKFLVPFSLFPLNDRLIFSVQPLRGGKVNKLFLSAKTFFDFFQLILPR